MGAGWKSGSVAFEARVATAESLSFKNTASTADGSMRPIPSRHTNVAVKRTVRTILTVFLISRIIPVMIDLIGIVILPYGRGFSAV
ncbi:MAG: hypothetical protein K0S39_836 [Paenibacillus sp.]|nr:hypothetical protein [Paenibacillus sp.]